MRKSPAAPKARNLSPVVIKSTVPAAAPAVRKRVVPTAKTAIAAPNTADRAMSPALFGAASKINVTVTIVAGFNESSNARPAIESKSPEVTIDSLLIVEVCRV
jgi:hypothetical protein